MNLKERIFAVYRNQMPDRIPCAIYQRYLLQGETERLTRNIGMGIIAFLPPVSYLSPPFLFHSNTLSKVKNCSFSVNYNWSEGEIVETRTVETPVGVLTQRSVGSVMQHVIKDLVYGGTWIKKHYIEKIEDYKIMRYVVEHTEFHSNQEHYKHLVNSIGDDGIALARLDRSGYQKLLVELAGAQVLIDIQIHTDPVESLINSINLKLREQADLVLDMKPEAVWIPDNITSDMTPPYFFEKYHLDFYQELAKKCNIAAIPLLIHLDGKIRALRDLLDNIPFAVIESLSLKDMSGDVNISEAKEFWPDKVICPNFPANLCLSSDEVIETFIAQVFSDFGPSTPFMLQISEDIPIEQYHRILPLVTNSVNKCQS